MLPRNPAHLARKALWTFVLSLSALPAALCPAQTQPPIRIVFDNHVDPFGQDNPAGRHDAYLNRIDWVNWALDRVEPLGVQVSFLSIGEFMEYVWEEGPSGPGAELLRRIYSMGSQIGSHSHQEYHRGIHDWPGVPVTDLGWSRRSWADNISWVDQGILTALGPSLPEPIEQINCVKGAHLPKTEEEYHQLMEEFDLGIRQAGPEEDYYAYFNHHIWHPFRPSTANYMAEDLSAPFVAIPAGPVIGKAGIHHGIYQDMSAPAVKRMFLQAYLNWRYQDSHGLAEKIWTFGWASHASDLAEGSATRAALVEVTSWLDEHFLHAIEPSGSHVAVWSTYKETAAAYNDWEARHPGTSSFSFDAGRIDWPSYPWLRAVAEEFEKARYVDQLTLPAGVQGHLLERDGDEMAVLWHPTGSATVDLSGVLTPPVRIVDLETGRLIGSDPSSIVVGPAPLIASEYAPHLSQVGDPRIGETFTVNIHGRAEELAILFASAGGRLTDAPHHGQMLLDPAMGFLRVFGDSIPPALGYLPVTIPLPDDSSLIGLEIHLQGVVTRFAGAGWLFTVNDIVDTITD